MTRVVTKLENLPRTGLRRWGSGGRWESTPFLPDSTSWQPSQLCHTGFFNRAPSRADLKGMLSTSPLKRPEALTTELQEAVESSCYASRTLVLFGRNQLAPAVPIFATEEEAVQTEGQGRGPRKP